MTEIVTIDKIREQANVREALKEMQREDIEAAMLHLIGISEGAAERVHALEVELANTRDHLERERRLNGTIKRRKKGRGKKVTDSQWFELLSAFDPKRIAKLPIPGQVFVLGHIDDMIIIEVPAEAADEEIQGFKKMLHDAGMTSAALIVKEGTRFLKLVPCDAAQTKAIEGQIRKLEDVQAQVTPPAAAEDGAEAGRAIY
jgi:hypothetical protein